MELPLSAFDIIALFVVCFLISLFKLAKHVAEFLIFNNYHYMLCLLTD